VARFDFLCNATLETVWIWAINSFITQLDAAPPTPILEVIAGSDFITPRRRIVSLTCTNISQRFNQKIVEQKENIYKKNVKISR